MNDNLGSTNPHQYVLNLDRESQLNIILEELIDERTRIEYIIQRVELALAS